MNEPIRLSPFEPVYPATAGDKRYWGRLYGASKALAISQLAQQMGKLVFVLTTDTLSALRLQSEIDFFSAKQIPVKIFPDWEILPYDMFSPYQDIVSERLATLAELPHLETGVLIAPITTAMHRLIPIDHLQSYSLMLQQGEVLDLDQFRKTLHTSGYVFAPTGA